MRSTTLRVSAVIGGLVVILLMHAIGFLRPVEDTVRSLFLPLARAGSYIGQAWGSREPTQKSIADFETRVHDLEARLASMSVDHVKLKALEEENRMLRDTAKFLANTGYDHVSARVIARSTDISRATILIDRGSTDGIEIGMAVVVGDGIYVGKITTLHEHVSTVTLAADPSSRVAASPIATTRLYGLIQGEGNGVARLTLVPQNEPLKANDIIVTAGTEEKIPPNLPIALVNEIQGKPTDPFKTATLEPLAHSGRLQLVAVLRPAVLRPEMTQ